MRFTVLRLVKLFHVRFVTNNISLHYSKLYAYNKSMGSDSKFNVLDASTLFFKARFKTRLKTQFELSRVKLYRNDLRENKNYFELVVGSSYRG